MRKRAGWYVIEDEVLPKYEVNENGMLYPPFFYMLKETPSWEMFEKYVYVLLKLIGIHIVHKFDEQKGHPDGFFKFKRLSVLYDCTLDKGFEKKKKLQIENFCSQLEKDTITIQKATIKIKSCAKEVWIITRGTSRMIEKSGEITIKEVSLDSLIDIYTWRLKYMCDDEELLDKLRDIGK